MSAENFFDGLYELRDVDDVRRHYQRFATDYDAELTTRGYAQPDRIADALVAAGVPLDARVLDAGCGSGLSGRALAARGYRHLHGCDYSTQMLALAEQTGVYESLHELDLNVVPPPVPGAPFDAVTAVGVVGHGHVAGAAIGGLAELLVPGGLLALAINELAWPVGDAKPALDDLVGRGLLQAYDAELGAHIPGVDKRGWVVTARRPG